MSNSYEIIDIHDSESEHELETSLTSVIPKLPRTTLQYVDMASLSSSFYVGPATLASQVDPRYAHTSNGWIDNGESIVPPSTFDIGQSPGIMHVVEKLR
ncbi:hypothetical protein HanIR_Chr12g0590591 [Helianthus annuus]|nr:hypothetical protein HanIR_Chr12g0590591 [Helianthus annuus]